MHKNNSKKRAKKVPAVFHVMYILTCKIYILITLHGFLTHAKWCGEQLVTELKWNSIKNTVTTVTKLYIHQRLFSITWSAKG